MQLCDPVLDRIPPLLVLPLREVEPPLRRAGGRLPLLVCRFPLFQPVEFLAQAVEVLRLLLKEGAFGLELRGDLPLIPDFGHPGLEGLEAGGAVLQGRRRTDPALVLRLEVLRLLRMEFELRLEFAHAISADLAFFVQASQLLLQTGEPTERFLAGGDLRFFRLDVGLQGRETFLRPLERLFENLQAEELLEHREALRSARGPELLHLLLPDEGRIPEPVVVEADHVPDPVRPVMTVYFSGNRRGGTVFSRYRMNPRISISSRTNPFGPGVGSRFGTAAVSISAASIRQAPPSGPGGPPL